VPELRAASERDWEVFSRLAASEGWRVPQRERQLLQGAWSEAVQVLGEAEIFCGLVSAVCHGLSGWIGNLLVPRRLRGQGYGRRLFEAAVETLEERGARSLWLTASAQGAPLYAQSGFETVGAIERWVLPARAGKSSLQVAAGRQARLAEADAAAWGGERSALLRALTRSTSVFAEGDAVALLQQDSDLEILGPWYAPEPCPRSNRLLLQQVLEVRQPRRELVVDLLAASPIRALLVAAGFTQVGENLLMVRGERDRVALPQMVSLASLGSIG